MFQRVKTGNLRLYTLFSQYIFCFIFISLNINPSLAYSPQQYIQLVNLSNADYGPLSQDTLLHSVCAVFFLMFVFVRFSVFITASHHKCGSFLYSVKV